jgi:transcriptional regulator with XRE-family HTH domain
VAGSIGSERSLARRIVYEREKRGWKQVALASRLTAAGCPMTQSGISKIENVEAPRRITVDELVALSQVFGIRAEELLLPPELVADQAARRLLEDWRASVEAERSARSALHAHILQHPSTGRVLEDLLTAEDRIALGAMTAADAEWAVAAMLEHNAGRTAGQ